MLKFREPGETPSPSTINREELIAGLAKIEALDDAGASIEDLTAAIHEIHSEASFSFKVPIVVPGERIYRVRPMNTRPTYPDELGQPPPEVAPMNRLSSRGESMFYGSRGDAEVNSLGGCLFECGAKVGDYFASSIWQVNKSMLFNHFGFSRETMDAMGEARTFEQYAVRDTADELGGILTAWQSKIFTRRVPKGSEHLYRLSIALAKFGLQPVRNFPPEYGEGYSGIVYPSVAINLIGDNVAILPKAADENLDLLEASYVRVTAILPAEEVCKTGMLIAKVDRLSVAYGCDEEGRLGWQRG